MIAAAEIILFIKQASLALTGAAALWGLYFIYKANKSTGEKKHVFKEIAHKMTEPLSISLFVFAISWFLIDFRTSYSVLAHEGITLDATTEQLIAAVHVTEPFVMALFAVFIIGLFYRQTHKHTYDNKLHYFYGAVLTLATIIISLPAWTGALDADKMFFIWHNMHSILTLGTVLVLDFVMLVAKYSKKYQTHLFPVLPAFSKVIWLGLALDFLSVAFVFERAIQIDAQFMFMQTVVAIIIINGIILSGPITQKLIESVKNKKEMPKTWNNIATISGCISIASWTTITFTDFLKGIDTVSYGSLILTYIGFIFITYIVYETLEHYKVGHNW